MPALVTVGEKLLITAGAVLKLREGGKTLFISNGIMVLKDLPVLSRATITAI